MASKLSIDIELNAKQYKQGAQEATKSTQDLQKSTEEYLKEFGPLNKQFAAARKEAKALAMQFAFLSDEEKKSNIGKELAAQYEIAIRKAAELKDINKDVDDAIRRASSDTLGLDTAKDVLEIGKDLATGYAGAIAKLTDNEKALKDVIANVTMIQGFANGAIKIANTLQKESNVMITLGNIQLKAKAMAEELATKKTVGATIAQKAFNAVAKANPYVLLATAVVAAATAIGGYMLATKKAGDETKLMAAKMESAKNVAKAFGDTLSSKTTELITKFTLLQSEYRNLSTNAEKVEWIKENSSAFNELGISIKNVNDADKVLIEQSADVIKALQLKAEAAALYAQYQKAMEEATQVNIDPVGQENEGDYAIAPVDPTIYTGAMVKQVNEAYAPVLDRVNDLNQQVADLLGKYKAKGKGSDNDEQLTELQKLEAEVTKYKKALENIDIKAPNSKELIKEVQNRLNKAQQAVKDYKLAVGLEVNNVDETLQKLQEAVNKAQTDYINAVKADDESAKTAAKETYYKAQDALNKYKLSITIEPKFDEEKFKQNLNNIAKNVFEPEAKKWDFSGFNFLPNGEQLAKTAEGAVNQIGKFKTAIADLNKLKDNTTDAKAKEQIDSMIDNYQKEIDVLESKADMLERLSKKEKKNAAAVDLNRRSYDMLFNSLGTISGALRDLGAEEAAQAVEFITNSTQMIAQCIQNIAALQTQAIAAGTASAAALPFPANLAAIASIVATITAIFASLAKFEQGGIIGGNSYSGDKLLIRANSSEMLLNPRQQNRLLQIANGMITPMTSGDLTLISAKVRGRDLLLVMNNELKSNRKQPIA